MGEQVLNRSPDRLPVVGALSFRGTCAMHENRCLELHDSTVRAARAEGSDVVLELRSYVHARPSVRGSIRGSGGTRMPSCGSDERRRPNDGPRIPTAG